MGLGTETWPGKQAGPDTQHPLWWGHVRSKEGCLQVIHPTAGFKCIPAGPECSGSSFLPTRAKEGWKLGWGQGIQEELGAEDGEKQIGRD